MNMLKRRRARSRGWIASGALRAAAPTVFTSLLAAGCMMDGGPHGGAYSGHRKEKLVDPGARSDIIRVSKFFSSDPWLCFNSDGSNRVDGVKFAVYLESTASPKGVFGTGTILVTMFRIEYSASGEEAPVPIYEWELPADRAYPYRAKKETMFGWGYGLRLPWDPNLEVQGRLVSFQVKYVREDGRVVHSSRQAARVPSTGSPLPPVASRGRAYSTFEWKDNQLAPTTGSAGAQPTQISSADPAAGSIEDVQGMSPGGNTVTPYGGRALVPIKPGLSRTTAKLGMNAGAGQGNSPPAARQNQAQKPAVAAAPADPNVTPAQPPAASRYKVSVSTEPPPRKVYQPQVEATTN